MFGVFSKQKPPWLEETRKLCRDAGINIMAWGPDLLTVEAKSSGRAKEIASRLGQLGFKVVKTRGNTAAGMLDLSRNPEAVKAKIASFDISRRRCQEMIGPLMLALVSLLLVPSISAKRYPPWISLPVGLLALVLFCWEASRIWGWRLDLVPEGIRVRRRFRWSTPIPWEQIRTVASVDAIRGNPECFLLKLRVRARFRNCLPQTEVA